MKAKPTSTQTIEGSLLTEFILQIFKLNGALIDAGNDLTAPYNLTSGKWQVMGAINLAGAPQTVAAIARKMGLTRQSVQRIVNDLVKIDMVELRHNPDHKRAKCIALSKKGVAPLDT